MSDGHDVDNPVLGEAVLDDAFGDELFEGAAVLTVAARDYPARVRLAGYLQPIDGRYHWQGTAFVELEDDVLRRPGSVSLTIDGRTASARIIERTPWGTLTIAGVGTPPYALDDIEVAIPDFPV